MRSQPKRRIAGQPAPLIDGPEKVRGQADYTADLWDENCLVGRILRSPVAHGHIISVDTSAAEAHSGVIAVVTGDDCDMTYGVIPIAKIGRAHV